jgi:hypothetical protein
VAMKYSSQEGRWENFSAAAAIWSTGLALALDMEITVTLDTRA